MSLAVARRMARTVLMAPAWTAPKQWFQTDHAPIVEGTVPDRLNRFAASIMEGDKQTAYQLSLGLHAEPDPAVRRQLGVAVALLRNH